MATYSETNSATGPSFSPPAKMVGVASNIITLGTADLVENATFTIGYLPPNSRVIDGFIAGTDMDSAASPALVLAVGDAADPDRFLNGGTVGQTASRQSFGNNATSAKTMVEHTGYTTRTAINATVITAPGTAVAGTLIGNVLYETLEPPTA